jgi:hypothetical protein
MSKFDRYKKKHKNNPKPEKKVLPKLGSAVESKDHGIGMVVNVNSKEAKAIYLDGLMRALENSK